ncbi:MAG TPA: hypothetical protein VFU47_04365 [Armatimonadota bacterium]|nr:hypothetical protein [Armatimonadota bacterium]
MSQHSQRVQNGPSRNTIVMGLALTLGGGTAVAYLLSGPLTARAIVGAVLGAGFTALMGLQTLERAVERRVALDRIERREAEEVARIERQRRIEEDRQRRAKEEARLRAEWERATYGAPGDEAEELERSRERAAQEWDEATYGPEPDPVATQPMEPDPARVEHWATGGEFPSQPDAYSVPAHPLPEERDWNAPGSAQWPTQVMARPDVDRSAEWPTEVMARQG